jgi:hypothetical protein
VDFVDNVNLVTAAARSNRRIGSELANLIDSAVTGSVDFEYVHVFTDGNGIANIAFVTGRRCGAFVTVEAFRKNSS